MSLAIVRPKVRPMRNAAKLGLILRLRLWLGLADFRKVCDDTQIKYVTLVINFSLLEASIHLPTVATCDTIAARIEVVSWPAAVRACLCSGTTSTQ